ncbi:heavy-metal-associated domain-containing protein [Haloimpatiens lingqiaonensis]|uniref:heavy-metal-associated domain-containing protein n=1 Tax=Haloimpatiens lingqiaonensis TaxID=1380675 RepID=UPI0010FF3AD4|nr:heavy-metal-associated domain-containing protein [Haloimpatiens lingqiaonensis]
MKNSHYEVSGLGNSQDKTKVLNALDRIEGVQEVAVDLARGTIEIGYNSPATKEKIIKCIENTGYTVK